MKQIEIFGLGKQGAVGPAKQKLGQRDEVAIMKTELPQTRTRQNPSEPDPQGPLGSA